MVASIDIPQQALVDEPINIRLTGFEPGQRVMLYARLIDDFDREWASQATFDADSQGQVDLSQSAPVEGTYQGVDPSGLLWSLAPAQGVVVNWPLTKKSTEPSIITFTAEVNGVTVAQAQFSQRYIGEGVQAHEVHEDGLVGVYFQPAGTGPFPAVLVFTGSGGGSGVLDINKAALLASRGYAALYLYYFNFEGVPQDLLNIPLEYFEKALHWLQRREGVNPDQIGVWGISRGGELALLLGATFREVKLVIAYAPSGVVWGGLSATGVQGAAWTLHGNPITPADDSHTPPEFLAEMGAAIGTDTIYAYSRLLGAAFQTAPNITEATIPVEKINGPVLLVSGKDDQMWPSPILAEVAHERLKQHQHPHPFKHISYDDVGHFLLIPSIPTTVGYILHPVLPIRLALGGQPRQNALANSDSWSHVLQFLKENFQ